ncbi:MAG TPA: ribonuclease T2 [Acidobacteriaceae bacterium]|jgi:ribonuclease T2|nr:ribonuclease T2 [Acidobacteriaceae bacterium]
MKKRTPSFLLILLLPIAACKSPQRSAPPPAAAHPQASLSSLPAPIAPQNFDYYLLNLSWSPEFCYFHPTAAECAQRAGFVLHGLWPENADGTYPESCSAAPGPANPSQYSDLYPDPTLLEHEWQTHGTCSGLSPDAFFSTARAALHSIVIPPTLAHLDHQISLPPVQILNLFTQSNPSLLNFNLALSCGHNYLTAVEVCLDKQLHPTACGQVRSCRATTVRIPSP